MADRRRIWDETKGEWRFSRSQGARRRADGQLDRRTMPEREKGRRSLALRTKWPIYHPGPDEDLRLLLREHFDRPGWIWSRDKDGYVLGEHERGAVVMILTPNSVQLSPRVFAALRKAVEAAERKAGIPTSLHQMVEEGLIRLMLDL